MLTFQDYEKAQDKLDFIRKLINEYRASDEYLNAVCADEYEKQQNRTILQYTKWIYTQSGQKVMDFTAANNKLASNYFHRLNTDRCAYSLGNGVSFSNKQTVDGATVDLTKERLGSKFDKMVYDAAYKALIHRISYTFWNLDHGVVFPATEFCPMWDELTGKLRAGVRFWSLDWDKKPVTVVLYEEEGYTKYQTRPGSSGLDLIEIEERKPYKVTVQSTPADGDEVIGVSNYGTLPIIPMWGNKNHVSSLSCLRNKIDAYDLVQSGFANDMQECAEIFWIVNNAMGMDSNDLSKFIDRLKLNHIATVDTDNGNVVPFTQNIPTEARMTFLTNLRNSLYEDFAVLDVHTVAAGATNDHIDAGYQPMDEEADDFEYQVIEYIQQILSLMGIEDTPIFKRNKISNQLQQTQMVMMCAEKLDEETLLNKLPFITVDEVSKVLANKAEEEASRMAMAMETAGVEMNE